MNRILLSVCLLISLNSFAQSPKAIEADLLKSFKKIGYWVASKDENAYEKLDKANDAFALKLKNSISTATFPKAYAFKQLAAEGLAIFTSSDSLFRIYCWDNGTGGTMRYYVNVIQYTYSNKTKAYLVTATGEGDNGVFYNKVYTFKTNDQTYYLGTFFSQGSSRYYNYGINIFSIQNGQLNTKTKLIKTTSRLTSSLNFEYDASLSDAKIKPDFQFDAETNTIKFPLTYESGRITTKFISYKFNGKYFEKVKS